MGRRDGPADFFVSYASADRAWAEWIAWELEADGYQVVIQAWDFTPGHNWAHAMQQATSTAERVVAVLSPAYLASAHGTVEWEVFYAADPSASWGGCCQSGSPRSTRPGCSGHGCTWTWSA
jgi:TIR domain